MITEAAKMNKEEKFLEIIAKTLTNSAFLGDDCAYLKAKNIVISQGALVEGVHFRLDTISAHDLGKKALLVNISDILASGAKPDYITVSVSGKLNENFIENFYKGVNEICQKYDVEVIGGDLTGGNQLVISISILGNTEGRNISSRKNVKPGYIVLLAGEHGSSAQGLAILSGQISEKHCYDNTFREHFIKAHIEPTLYPKISETIAITAKEPYAMMDTSDGLYDALKKVSEASAVGFEVDFDKIPRRVNDAKKVLFGGEDFGLLICLSREDYDRVKHLGLPVIAKATEEKIILIDGVRIQEDERFAHF